MHLKGNIQLVILVLVTCLVGGTASAHTQPVNLERKKVGVEQVMVTEAGKYVILLKTLGAPYLYLPIRVGAREAIAIKLRLERQSPPRPMTINLTESILLSSQSKLHSVLIDEVHGDMFLGEIKIKRENRVWSLDARPSDAIALALGQNVAIWVNKSVLNRAAFESGVLDEYLKSTDEEEGISTGQNTGEEETL